MGTYAVAPSYVAYATLIHQLDGAHYVRREACREYSRAQVHHFRRGDEDVRVCWSTTPSRLRLETQTPLTVVNLMGTESTLAPVDGAVVIDLSEDAVYVRGEASAVTEIDTGVHTEIRASMSGAQIAALMAAPVRTAPIPAGARFRVERSEGLVLHVRRAEE